MSPSDEYKRELSVIKSLLIVTALQKKDDLRAIRYIQEYSKDLVWEPLTALMIDEQVWHYSVNKQRYDPKLIFCHPSLLLHKPATSLYYRGLCGLSLKAARSYFGSVESLEAETPRARLADAKALRMAKTYNTLICSVVKGSTDWTLENGRRTILATMGITLDGKMRNKIGEIAEDRIRRLIVDSLVQRELVVTPKMAQEQVQSVDRIPRRYELQGGIVMRFGSDPDVEFTRGSEVLAVIEIKGGIDAAGALERYGAATKSFQHAVKKSPKCRNFYLGAVYTSELNRRIASDRLVERSFDIVSILRSDEDRNLFLDELLHHTLRLL